MDPNALFHKAMQALEKEKYCMHPDQDNCSGKIIKAHTISKSSALKPMAVDGHIYMFPHKDLKAFNKARQLGYIEPQKVGINNASTFTGFCSYHDNNQFESIDDPNMEVGLNEAMLLSYRTFAREVYAKKGVIKGLEIMSTEGKYSNPFLNEQITSHKLGLQDLLEEEKEFHDILNGLDSKYSYHLIELSGSPSFACSGGFFPEYSFSGEELQDLKNPNLEMQKLWVNIIPRGNTKAEAIFCWKEKHDKVEQFISSLLAIDASKIPTALTWLCFEHFENLAISPLWWDSMRQMRKLTLCRHFYKMIQSDVIREPDYLDFGTRTFTNWSTN